MVNGMEKNFQYLFILFTTKNVYFSEIQSLYSVINFSRLNMSDPLNHWALKFCINLLQFWMLLIGKIELVKSCMHCLTESNFFYNIIQHLSIINFLWHSGYGTLLEPVVFGDFTLIFILININRVHEIFNKYTFVSYSISSWFSKKTLILLSKLRTDWVIFQKRWKS